MNTTEDPSTVDEKGNDTVTVDKVEIIDDNEIFANARWTDDEHTML